MNDFWNDNSSQQKKKNLTQFKYAIQEFMNENIEIVKAIINNSKSPEKMSELKYLIDTSKQLSIKIASRILEKHEDQCDKFDIKPFRKTSALIVSTLWQKNSEFDLDKIADSIFQAASKVDPDEEFNIYKFLNISRDVSFLMTASNVTLKLYNLTSIYNFRKNNNDEILTLLSEAVLQQAHKGVSEVITTEHSEDDKTSLLQTFSNNLSEILATIYKKEVRNTLSKLKGMKEDKINEFYANNDPLKNILSDFNKFSLYYYGLSFAYASGFNEARENTVLKKGA